MSSGCAVIGTNVGGIPFVIKGGYNGILVRQNNKLELSNSITSLLKDQEKSQKLGNNAAKSVRKDYSWEKISKDFIKLYEGILK